MCNSSADAIDAEIIDELKHGKKWNQTESTTG